MNAVVDHNAQHLWGEGWSLPEPSAFGVIETAGKITLDDGQRATIQWACCRYFATSSQLRLASKTNHNRTDATKLANKILRRLKEVAELPELLADLDLMRAANPELVDGIERRLEVSLSTARVDLLARFGLLKYRETDECSEGIDIISDAITKALKDCKAGRERNFVLDDFLIEIGGIYGIAGGNFTAYWSPAKDHHDSLFCEFAASIMNAAPEVFSTIDVDYRKLTERVRRILKKKRLSLDEAIGAVTKDIKAQNLRLTGGLRAA